MYSFPVDVSRTPDGDYEARLADLQDSPVGHGVDPYAALDDLGTLVRPQLRQLHGEGALPEPSESDDRPTLDFDPDAPENGLSGPTMVDGQVSDDGLVGYSWTNTTVVTGRDG